jgi:hypothetical protein
MTGMARQAFVFDLMEPERPKVDSVVLAFLKSEALHPADFTIREDGVARLIRSGQGAWRRWQTTESRNVSSDG